MALLKAKGKKPVVVIDDGHGMSTAGKRTPIFPSNSGMKSETGNFMHENEFNRAVVKYLKVELNKNGITTVESAPGDADTSITQRCKTANAAKADLFLSVHANALNAKWGPQNGVETLSHPKNKALAMVFQKWLMKGTKQTNRGWKDGSWLGIVKGTNMPAILVEAGFMDNLVEAKLLLSDAYRKECAKELAQAVCEVFGIKYNNPTTSSTNSATKASTSSYPYDATKGIGTVKILANELNVRKGASFTAPVMATLSKGGVYYVYETKNGLHRVSNEGWVSAGAAYTKFTPHPKRSTYKVVKGDTLWGISRKHNLTVDQLKKLNPGLTDKINPDDIIYLS